MHCSHQTFHFLSVSNGPTPILSDVEILLRKSHKIIFVGYFWKITNTCERCFEDVSETSRERHLFWDMLEMSSRHHTKDIIFEKFLRRYIDITKRHLFWVMYLRPLKDVKKKLIFFEMFLTGLWDVFFNGDLIEISQRYFTLARIDFNTTSFTSNNAYISMLTPSICFCTLTGLLQIQKLGQPMYVTIDPPWMGFIEWKYFENKVPLDHLKSFFFFSIIMIYTKTKERKNKSTYNSAPTIFCVVGEK